MTGRQIRIQFGAQEERTNAPNDQGYLAVSEIVYLTAGWRWARSLEPILLFSHAKPGDKILVAVKLLATPTEKSMARASLRIDFAPGGRPADRPAATSWMVPGRVLHMQAAEDPLYASAFGLATDLRR